MVRLAANLTTMFSEWPFLKRFKAASDAGFEAVEFLFPYQYSASVLKQTLDAEGLNQVLINAPAGDWESGDRGFAALRGRDEEFCESIALAVDYAKTLECPRVHVMAGAGVRDDHGLDRYIERVRFAADELARIGATVTIEPLNPRDMPGYFLHSVLQAITAIQAVDRSNVGLQLDFYHAQILHGDLTKLLRDVIDFVAHVQIASVPDRHEPNRGEVSYRHIFRQLDALGYTGWVGCEYFPKASTLEGLGWVSDLTAET